MKALTVLFAVLTLAGFSVVAQAGEDDQKATFKKLDQDKNGTLDMSEAITGGITADNFKEYDANADDTLDWQEFLALYKQDSGDKSESDRK